MSTLLGDITRCAAEDPWTCYWLPGFIALAVLLVLAVVPVRTLRVAGRPALFVVACTAALLALRWPAFLADLPYNVDEVQFAATALGLLKNAGLGPILEAGTSGPLNSWYLALPAALGLEIDLPSGRLMALVCEAIMVAGCYGALRAAYDERTARLAVLPLVATLGLARFRDFVHPSSEHLPVALAGIGSWLLARSMWAEPRVMPGLMLALGSVAGAMPLAKLQSAPLAGTMVLFGALVAVPRAEDRRRRALLLAALGVGACSLTLLAVCVLALRGRLGWYVDLYVLMNLRYANQGHPLGQTIRSLRDELGPPAIGVEELRVWFTYSFGLFLIALGRLAGRSSDGWSRLFSVYAAALVIASAAAVVMPGRPFGHYLLLLVPGLSLAAAGAIVSRRPALQWLCMLSLVVLVVLPRASHTGAVVNEPARQPIHPVSRMVRSAARPGDRLTVWGWASWLHLETRLPQGTDYQVPYWALAQNPRRRYFRALWLRDFKRLRPEFFVDAVAPGEIWSTWSDRHDSFPALAAWIRHAYEPLGENSGRRAYRVRRPPG